MLHCSVAGEVRNISSDFRERRTKFENDFLTRSIEKMEINNEYPTKFVINKIVPVPDPVKEHVMTYKVCDHCRATTKKACVGSPCKRCTKAGIECVRSTFTNKSLFKKGECSGENNTHCLLNTAQIHEIRSRYMKGTHYGEQPKWAKEFGVSVSLIRSVCTKIGYRMEAGAVPEGFPLR